MSKFKEFFETNGTTMRIAMGQASTVITLLLVAAFFGLVPDSNKAVVEGRAKLAEAVAANSSIFITQSDLRRMEANLRLILSRNPDILSAAVRKGDEAPMITVGEHTGNWLKEDATNTQLLVPVWEGETQWGQVELRFTPLGPTGPLAFFFQPVTLLIMFIGLLSFILFFFYLRKMLKDLDPSQAIPDRVRSALDTMAEGLLVLDAKQNIVLANEAFSTLVGISAGKLLGQKAGAFKWTNPDGTAMDRESYPWTKALNDSISQRNQPVHLNVDGHSKRTFQTNCSPVLTTEGAAGGVLISFDDITELEEKEKQLIQSQIEAEQANQAKSDFLANMSHEIRTPMTVIMGFTEVLKRAYTNRNSDTVEGDSLHYLNSIADSSQHLLDLINDILDLSKVEAGHVEVEQIPCSAHKIVQDVMQIMAGKAQEKGLALTFEPDGPLPESILSDPSRLRQIMINLVGNAIKFTDSGKVSVVTSLSQGTSEPMMTISVHDTGIGMTPSQADSVFSPFVQADTSITRRFGGTGLGLSICKRFAEAMGGDVKASSEVGKGSVFSIVIPVGNLEGVAMLSPEQLQLAEVAQSESAKRPWMFKPAKILLVDDGAENRELLSLVLGEQGLDITTAVNGQDGLDKLAQGSFEMILMDVQMPVMDGFTAVGKIREMGMDLPVIALTADAMKGAEQRCLAAGYSGYLTKPINFEALVERMAQDLDGEFVDNVPGAAASATTTTTVKKAAVQRPESAQTGDYPIFSDLEGGDEKYQDIIVRFVARLKQQISTIEQAIDNEQYDALADLGHWLKGSAGSVGFHAFDEPGQELEQAALRHNRKELSSVVRQISILGARVAAAYPDVDALEGDAGQIPAMPRDGRRNRANQLPQVVTSDMMGNEKLRPHVEKFVERLANQLDTLDQAIVDDDLGQVGDLAHWLKGSAGTLGLHDFTEPATELEARAQAGDAPGVKSQAVIIRTLFDRIQLTETGEAL